MDINTYIYGAILLIQIISTIVIINHKNVIIKDLQSVMQSTDIKRLAEYYSKMDELKKTDLLHVKRAAFREVDRVLAEHYNKIGRQYDEMATFIGELYDAIPDEAQRKAFIQNHMPTCINMFPFDKEETESGSPHKS